jgi:hypothetical protein
VTQKRSLKRRVRERISKTGERYTAARRQILAKPPEPERARPLAAVPLAAEPLHGPTNRTWTEWIRLLDESGAADRSHRDIARWLGTEHGVPDWWTQDITVRYEKHIGRRVVGQRGDTFSASATKTIHVPPEVARAAWTDGNRRARWLRDVHLSQRPNRVQVAARFDVNDGEGRVVVSFDPRRDSRTLVAIEHEKLPDADLAKRWTRFWRERLVALKEMLESE